MVIEFFAMFFFIGVVFVTIIGVLDRFILGFGLTWTEEAARYLLIWASFTSAAAVTRRSDHFKVDIFSRFLGKYSKKTIALFCMLVSLAVCGYGVKMTIIVNAQTSPALGLPMSVVYAAVPVSFAVISFYLARQLFVPEGYGEAGPTGQDDIDEMGHS